jgi:SAM-dependent methyltransferase
MPRDPKPQNLDFPGSAVKIRPCPVCGSAGPHKKLHQQGFSEGVLGDGYDVVVCQDCGAGFADGIPSQADLDRYYAERSKYSYDGSGGAESPYDMARFAWTVDQLASRLPSHSLRILDVGCATGGLLSVFKQRGFANVLGADPSPACAAAARKLHGIEVRAATLAELSGWSERFDLVCMLGVLEHLRDVAPAVRTVARLMKPRGLFYAAVPDVEGLVEARNAPYQQFSMEHVNFFSRRSLDRLMASCGFAVASHWRTVLEWREGVTEPILAGLYEVTGDREREGGSRPPSASGSGHHSVAPSRAPSHPLPRSLAPSLARDAVTESALERYLASSRAGDEKIRARIDALVRAREPLLVWGAGALTRRLLASTALAHANIAAFVDSSLHLQGTELAGRKVLSPTQLTGHKEPILICSVAFEQEITRTIRHRLNLPNRVITLS